MTLARKLCIHLAVALSWAGGLAAQEIALQNWPAPPYWVSRESGGSSAPAGSDEARGIQAASVVTAPMAFYAVTPCRLADTRGPSGPFGGPPLAAATLRDFSVVGSCGVPSNAGAVSFNFTVTNTLGPGFILAFPQGTPPPGVSTLNYLANQTVANAAVVPLGATGAFTAVAGVSGCDLIVDINGYYAPQATVSSLNGLSGSVSLFAGSNLTITPTGNGLTLTVPLTGLNASNVTSGTLGLTFGGTGSNNAAGARLNLGAAARGANADITSLSALSTPLSVAQGGTGSATPFSAGFQARITGTCAAGFLVSVAPDGTVGCASPTVDPRPGFSRTAIDTASVVGGSTSIAIGVDGLGIVSYQDITNGRLKVAHCSNPACTSATSTTIDSSPGVGAHSSIAIGTDGLALISYADITNGDLRVAHCNDVPCGSASLAAVDTVGDVGRYTSIAIGVDGLGLISYYDFANSRLKVAHCNNVACASAVSSVADPNSAGYYTSIVIGGDGLGLISYYALAGGDLRIAHCLNLDCTIRRLSTADSAGDTGWFSSITVGSDGLGLISYFDNTNGFLKVAHCGDPDCSTATTAVNDFGGFVGQHTAISIGSDGRPVIGYYDFTNRTLKIAHCGDANCTSGVQRSTVDATANVGVGTSLTIGPDGLPLVSYWDQTNGYLKVLHCGSVLCAPNVRRR